MIKKELFKKYKKQHIKHIEKIKDGFIISINFEKDKY